MLGGGADAIAGDRLEQLRDLIDQLDEEIIQKLGARMDIAERIGEHKHEHNVAILQPERWERIMRRQLRLGTGLGLDPVDQGVLLLRAEAEVGLA